MTRLVMYVGQTTLPAMSVELTTHLVTPARLVALTMHPATFVGLTTQLAMSAVPMTLPVAPAKLAALTTRLPAVCNSDIRAV